MTIDWPWDAVALLLLAIQILVISYAFFAWNAKRMKLSKAQVYFIVTLTFMMLGRAFLVSRCVDVGDYPYVQYPIMLMVNVGAVMVIREWGARR